MSTSKLTPINTNFTLQLHPLGSPCISYCPQHCHHLALADSVFWYSFHLTCAIFSIFSPFFTPESPSPCQSCRCFDVSSLLAYIHPPPPWPLMTLRHFISLTNPVEASPLRNHPCLLFSHLFCVAIKSSCKFTVIFMRLHETNISIMGIVEV